MISHSTGHTAQVPSLPGRLSIFPADVIPCVSSQRTIGGPQIILKCSMSGYTDDFGPKFQKLEMVYTLPQINRSTLRTAND